jgi:hypothetical protein
MRGKERDGFGDGRRTGVIEGWKLHARSVRVSLDQASPTEPVEISLFFVTLAPQPVNDTGAAKSFRFC